MSDKQRKKKTIAIDAVLFDLLVFGFFLLLAIVSLKYNPRARSIPLALGIVGSLMTFLQFLVDAFPRTRSILRFVGSSGLLANESPFERKKSGEAPSREMGKTKKEATEGTEWWRVFRIILWLVGFLILLAFTKYLIAVGAFVILVTRLEARESWKRAILLGVGVDLGFYILFDVLLQAQL